MWPGHLNRQQTPAQLIPGLGLGPEIWTRAVFWQNQALTVTPYCRWCVCVQEHKIQTNFWISLKCEVIYWPWGNVNYVVGSPKASRLSVREYLLWRRASLATKMLACAEWSWFIMMEAAEYWTISTRQGPSCASPPQKVAPMGPESSLW